jgi:hypothetical protein
MFLNFEFEPKLLIRLRNHTSTAFDIRMLMWSFKLLPCTYASTAAYGRNGTPYHRPVPEYVGVTRRYDRTSLIAMVEERQY